MDKEKYLAEKKETLYLENKTKQWNTPSVNLKI